MKKKYIPPEVREEMRRNGLKGWEVRRKNILRRAREKKRLEREAKAKGAHSPRKGK